MQALQAMAAMAIGLVLAALPAKAADNLECMSAPYGQPEKALLDQNTEARRGDDARSRAVFEAIEARGRTCAYLYGWSPSARRIAVIHRWKSEQWFNSKMTPAFTVDQQTKLRVALEPKKPNLVAIFATVVEAVERGQDEPAPIPDANRFREYHPLLTEVGILRNRQTEQLLDGWLYTEGVVAALEQGFRSH